MTQPSTADQIAQELGLNKRLIAFRRTTAEAGVERFVVAYRELSRTFVGELDLNAHTLQHRGRVADDTRSISTAMDRAHELATEGGAR